MVTVEQIFENLGGTAKTAQVLAVKNTAASEMKRRRSIPVKYWPKLVEGCRARGIKGITYDLLVRLHSNKDAA